MMDKTHIFPAMASVWPQSLTRNVSTLIQSSRSTTLISPATDNETQRIMLFAIVCSAVTNVYERNAIRQSWGSPELVPKDTRVVFLMGRPESTSAQADINDEADKYGDIVQEDFLDNYTNLTVKTLLLLKWFLRHSRKEPEPYVLKTDDDVYINLSTLKLELLSYRTSNKDKKALLLGNLFCRARPIRDPYNKWFAPQHMFNGTFYPNYLSGTGYALSRHTAEPLLKAALDTPIFHLEDIYITGILARKIGVRPEDHLGFFFQKRPFSMCLYAQIISSHHSTPEEMILMATQLQKMAPDDCNSATKHPLHRHGPKRCSWK